ncbi:N-acetylmuramoyl-L-alanine amidase family protein [Cohnella candidum]|uniref:N-acetylmuramoyl-L-alanine amidase n=1 Tax=Cohnella candidum TaxID=2674991 RepID=A0A3G3JXV5_9BACL|nr:N-acetylmuramoyl-L-alanine amidase [Cohnella candidum]AYQ73086.1 N-acetylmuramoyl-L-alanine amidase [Cohnella candidum]
MRPTLLVMLLIAVLAGSTGWSAPQGPVETAADAVPPDILRAIPSADVIIDAGHGGIDGGTHFGDVKESNINLAIGRKLYLLLRSRGVRAVLNRTGDYALSDENRWHVTRSRHRKDLSQRRGLSDEIDARMLVSLHANWSPRGGGNGPIVLYRKDDGRGALLAFFLQDSLNRQQGKRNRTKPAKRFYLLNTVKVPSVIVETGFLSDPGDRAMLTSPRGQTRIAEAMTAAILAYRCLDP